MAEEYKETLEWKALGRIWKAIEPARRQELMEDFRLLADWVKRDMEPARPQEDAGESGFLNGLSPRAKALVLRRLTAGQGNLYDECRELARGGAGEEEAWSRFRAEHGGDAALLGSEEEVREILRACLRK